QLQTANAKLQDSNRENHEALIRLNVINGIHYLGDSDLFSSLIWFSAALKLEDDTARQHAHRLRIGAVLADCPRLEQLWRHEDGVTDVAFSPDPALPAIAASSVALAGSPAGRGA